MKGLIVAATLSLGLVLTSGCDKKDAASSGCEKDTDCKGDRVCIDGACRADDGDEDGPKKKRKREDRESIEDTVGAKPAKTSPSPFQEAEQAAATTRLGPKLKAGSKVAHTIFEGPFGPSPRSLFAVTKRADETLYVVVMGEDGKAWPAGPLADPDAFQAHEVTAVSFFDADGDGTTDALVMATYSPLRAGKPFNINVLLTWTEQGMRRLLKLEPKIAHLASVADVKRALAR
jgi:hypothetical protein